MWSVTLPTMIGFIKIKDLEERAMGNLLKGMLLVQMMHGDITAVGAF